MITGPGEQPDPLDREEGEEASTIALPFDPTAAEVAETASAQSENQDPAAPASARVRVPSAPPTLARRSLLQTWRHCGVMALCLGLGVGAVVARLTWQYLPAPQPLYRASSVLRVEWTHPHLRGLVGERANAEGGERIQALGDLIRTRSILQEALQSPAVADLSSVHDNSEEAFHRIEQGLRVESNNSQVVHINLVGAEADELPPVVNAVKRAFLKSYVDDDKRAKRSRLAELDRAYKEAQKDLLKNRKELQAATNKVETDSLDAERLSEFQKQKARAEVELVAARVRLASLQGEPQSKEPKTDAEALDAQIEVMANKDRKIREMQAQADHLLVYIRELERISAKPSKLPEYSDAVADHQALLLAIVRRKRSLRPELQKIIREKEESKEPVEDPLENARREVVLYEAQLKELTKRIGEQVAARAVLDEARRKLSTRRAETAEQKSLEIERLEKAAQVTFAEAETIRKELNGPVAAVALDDADHAEALPIDHSQGLETAGVAGLGAFCLVVLGIGYHEHLQRRIRHSDDVIHELSMPLLAATPALSQRLDLFNAPLEESQAASPFLERCRAIDGICPFVLHDAAPGEARFVMVTSAMGNEGETELASLLAYRLARAGKRTLLIDADLVTPRTHDVVGEPAEPGLSDVLRGQAAWTDVIRPAQATDLWFVVAGHADHQAAEAMAREEMGALLEQLRSEYDAVIVDASAVLTMSHGLQIGRHADAAILTVRHEISRTVSVFAAQQKLHMLGIPVLGAVYVAGSSRNWLGGIRASINSMMSIFSGVTSIFGVVGTAGTSAWKRFGSLQSPIQTYQPQAYNDSQVKKAA